VDAQYVNLIVMYITRFRKNPVYIILYLNHILLTIIRCFVRFVKLHIVQNLTFSGPGWSSGRTSVHLAPSNRIIIGSNSTGTRLLYL